MSNLQTGTLRAYEVLKGITGGSANKLDALMAFMEPIFALHNGEILDVSEFVDELNSQMKLSLTDDVFLDLIPSLEKKGWISRASSELNSPAYTISCQKIPTPETKSIETLQNLAIEFEHFIESCGISKIAFPRNQKILTDYLIEWLISIDTSDEISITTATQHGNKNEDQAIYLCARFVSVKISQNSNIVRDLQLISDVGLISELVREFRRPFSTIKTSDLTIIVDSPIIMEICGLAGSSARESTTKLVNQLLSRNVKFAFINGSIDEMRRSVQAMFDLPIFDRYGSTHTSMQKGEIDEPYVRSVYQNCIMILSEAKIFPLGLKLNQLRLNPHHFSAKYVDILRHDLENTYISQNNSYNRAKHDADAVASVMRLRSGQFSTSDIFQSKYVFLTRNQAFRATARAFCLRTVDVPVHDGPILMPEEVGPVVDIRELASAAWFGMGADDAEEYSRSALMAGCERVLRLNRKVVGKVATVVNKMSLTPENSAEKIRKVRIALMHPGISLYLQDQIRGGGLEMSYEEVIQQQQKFEEENIEKGVAKIANHYRSEILAMSEKLSDEERKIIEHKAEINDLTKLKLESELEKEKIKKESSEEIERLHNLNSENRKIVILEIEKKGQRIIDNSIDYLKQLRLRYKICGFVFIILLYFIKEAIAKVWNKNFEIEILSYGVYVPVLVAVFFGMALIVIESTAGIFGESKIPFVRKWFKSSLNRAVRSHAEYQDFSENQFGLVIEQVGSDLELVQHEFTKLDKAPREI